MFGRNITLWIQSTPKKTNRIRWKRCLAFSCSSSWIRKTKEDRRATTAMKEEIDWKKELLESGKFNNQFSKNILENEVKNYMQEIYMGYMYSRWRKIRKYK